MIFVFFRPEPAPAEVDDAQRVREEELNKVRGAHFSFRNSNIKILNLRDVYNEFYGLEGFKDQPIAGGFAAVDRRYKPREWRDTTKHGWKQSDQNRFSRVKRVCEALKNSRSDGEDAYPEAVGLEYDGVMKSKGLLGVVGKMQDDGLLTLGPARAPKQRRTA